MTLARRSVWLLAAAVLCAACQDDPTTGALVVTVNGLPAGTLAAIEVIGPNQFSRAVVATTTLEGLPPGEYTVRAGVVTHSHAPFSTALDETKHQVTAGGTGAASVTYSLTGGSIDLAVIGLPAGAAPRIKLIGSSSRDVTAAGFVDAIPAGTYVIQADTAQNSDGDRFASTLFNQTVTIHPSLASVSASVTYALASGTLALSIDGLPPGSDPAPVTVAGPDGYVRRLNASQTLRGLSPGTYSIMAATHHESCPLAFAPVVGQQIIDIATGTTDNRSVSYGQVSVSAATLNLRIDAIHLTQITQDLSGAVPLLAGKEALLRVFGTASEGNSVRPTVRVTLSNGTVIDLGASEASVRETAAPGIIAASWNVVVPASAVAAGLTAVAEIDPGNKICETNESDNRFPATGVMTADVRMGPTIGIRFLRVRNSAGFVGLVNGERLDAFLAYSRKVHPISEYDADIRLVPYATTRGGFQANDQNGNWSAVLGELSALRVAEGSERYYHGIVRVTYNSGIAGIGVIGGKAALTWDYLPSGSEVVAHELGHNFARFHAPCGNPGGPDRFYPDTGEYAGGKIGQVGYDVAERALKLPTAFADFMSYCKPTWTSDYTYKGILAWLTDPARGPTLPIASAPSRIPSLLVWGRIVDGVPVLEPAFEITTRPAMPTSPGRHRLSIEDDARAEILGFEFAGEQVADLPNDVETFAFAVPISMLRGRAPATLALSSRGGTVRHSARSTAITDPAATVDRLGGVAVRVRWDSTRFPMALVRDPVSGDVLSFARGGDVTVETNRGEIEISYSNQIHSSRRRVSIPR